MLQCGLIESLTLSKKKESKKLKFICRKAEIWIASDQKVAADHEKLSRYNQRGMWMNCGFGISSLACC